MARLGWLVAAVLALMLITRPVPIATADGDYEARIAALEARQAAWQPNIDSLNTWQVATDKSLQKTWQTMQGVEYRSQGAANLEQRLINAEAAIKGLQSTPVGASQSVLDRLTALEKGLTSSIRDYVIGHCVATGPADYYGEYKISCL